MKAREVHLIDTAPATRLCDKGVTMSNVEYGRRVSVGITILGLAAAFFLLDTRVSWWLRILPWVMVFGYPVWRMARSART